MTLQQIPPPPALPPLPEPSGYGWGQDHLDAYRLRQHLLTEWSVRVAHATDMAAMDRHAERVEAAADHRRRLRAVDLLDAPTIEVAVVPPGRHEAASTEETEQDEASSGWDPKDKAYGTVKERARRWLFEQLAADPTRTFKARTVNDGVGAFGQIKGHEINAWRAEWEASRVDA